MIITTQIEHCPKCNSINIIKNGTDYKNSQKYHCHDCNSYGTLKARSRYPEATKRQVLQTYLERVSMRGIERIYGIARATLASWLEKAAQALPPLAQNLLPQKAADVLELDEAWSFVYKKKQKRWLWTALCRRSRQIVAFVIGDRSEATCRRLWQAIPESYRQCRSYSDFWDAYRKVFDADTHKSVGKDSGETAHQERWYNTLRQWLGRFTRKTLSFSKSDYHHLLVTRWFITEYNLMKALSLTI